MPKPNDLSKTELLQLMHSPTRNLPRKEEKPRSLVREGDEAI